MDADDRHRRRTYGGARVDVQERGGRRRDVVNGDALVSGRVRSLTAPDAVERQRLRYLDPDRPRLRLPYRLERIRRYQSACDWNRDRGGSAAHASRQSDG